MGELSGYATGDIGQQIIQPNIAQRCRWKSKSKFITPKTDVWIRSGQHIGYSNHFVNFSSDLDENVGQRSHPQKAHLYSLVDGFLAVWKKTRILLNSFASDM